MNGIKKKSVFFYVEFDFYPQAYSSRLWENLQIPFLSWRNAKKNWIHDQWYIDGH